MLTMVSCEDTAAASRGWSAFDWAEHCLKQERKIKEEYNCAEIFETIIDVASGKETKSECLGFGGVEFVPWQRGAVL